jgi:hypothetical protein
MRPHEEVDEPGAGGSSIDARRQKAFGLFVEIVGWMAYTFDGRCSYTLGRNHRRVIPLSGGSAVQTAQPRDLGALALVVGLFVILLVVTLTVGGSAAAIR